jgi:hypothetical protein
MARKDRQSSHVKLGLLHAGQTKSYTCLQESKKGRTTGSEDGHTNPEEQDGAGEGEQSDHTLGKWR